MGLVVTVPAAQGGIAGVGEKELQRRRFNVAVAKDHVGLVSHLIQQKQEKNHSKKQCQHNEKNNKNRIGAVNVA